MDGGGAGPPVLDPDTLLGLGDRVALKASDAVEQRACVSGGQVSWGSC
jgi:hypothetical protein